MSIARPVHSTSVVRDPNILGGEPVVRGTRIAVRTIVVAYQGWGDIDRITREYPQLTRNDVEQALAYYDSHRLEIDQYIRDNLDD